ncbi:MAG: DUF2071 domain-containing protein [Planctomycetes bacterium]|nr:DUF2071 domain-containing protein [Planctomycetota bacterium]
MPERPLLTARWTELLLLNFPVPVNAIETLAPPGTEPDLHDGQAYISVVGFRFHAVRFFGLPVPGHTSFPEINLRYYVRRQVGDETRRGVVFVREIAPRRAVAYTANWLYNENYITRPMRSTLQVSGPILAPGDTLEYAWRSNCSWPLRGRPPRGQPHHRWNRLAARVAAPLALPARNSLEEFFVEHYWGYVRARDGTTREYRVTHDPWQVAPADNVTWDCDLPATYTTPLAEYLNQSPSSAIVATGSPIQLHRGRRL